MIKLFDITYYSHTDLEDANQVLAKHSLVTRYSRFLKTDIETTFIMHAGFEGSMEQDGSKYYFFKGLNHFWFLPFKSSRFIARQKPDVVLVQGLGFPLQIILLKLFMPHCKIMVQHHGELPFRGIRLIFQRLASSFVSGWLFTARDNTQPWKKKRVINSHHAIFEVLEASTDVHMLNKMDCRFALGLSYNHEIFLWVGRLNLNKDPLLVLKAFNYYSAARPDARLYMIYQTEELLPEMNEFIAANRRLANMVTLVGNVSHDAMSAWYSAADFFISASHKEGSGYALIEALACGCIPVVTDIPPFRKITNEGACGVLYETGNSAALLNTLFNLKNFRLNRNEVIEHFRRNLSFNRIAQQMRYAVEEVCPYKAITLSATSSAEKSNTAL